MAGARPVPPVEGDLVGIPVHPALVERLLGPVLGRPKKESEDQPAETREKRPLRERLEPVLGALRTEMDRLGAALRIDVMKLDLAYGTGDAASTAILTGVAFDLASLLPAPCEVRFFPSWTEERLAMAGQARLLVFPWQTLVAVLCLRSALKRGGVSHGG